jgi:hypothetical protein
MASTVTMSTVYVAERNGQCQHCGHRFFSSEPNPAPLCYHCKSAGRTVETAEPVETPVSVSTIDPAYADVPDFETYDDYAAYFADDLRDAALKRELDDYEVAS